jgi:hypothetical protein
MLILGISRPYDICTVVEGKHTKSIYEKKKKLYRKSINAPNRLCIYRHTIAVKFINIFPLNVYVNRK